MTWRMIMVGVPTCDRCGTELEDEENGYTPFFEEGEYPDGYGWHKVGTADGAQDVCADCWESIGAEDATIAEASRRYDQRGPDLLGSIVDGDGR